MAGSVQWFDPSLVAAGLVVGFVVGLTGMGGGALMTPMLILLFRVDALTAVSSDLVVSLFMKPGGAFVHLRRGTVNLRLVGWLCVGSVPAAFGGIWLLRIIPGVSGDISTVVQLLAGIALVVGAAGIATRAAYAGWRHRHDPAAALVDVREIVVRPVPTVILGAVGGLMVGMTSVGAGSIIVVVLLLLYPSLRANSLVGTDLVQAVPLVAGATLGHLLFGSISFGIAVSLLVGAIPAAWFGAQLSSRAPDAVIKPALFVLLLCSGAKLVGVPTADVLVAGAIVVVAVLAWSAARFLRRRLAQAAAVAEEESRG